MNGGPGTGTGVLDFGRGILHFLLALPRQATPFAHHVDDLQYVQMVTFALIGLVVFGCTGWFLVRWSRRGVTDEGEGEARVTPRVIAPRWAEALVVGVLLSMFLGWWVWGFRQYAGEQAVQDDAYEIYVTGKQWMWKFDYPDGRTTAGVLYVPQGRDVRLLLTSRDVIHSFFVPDFRMKQDAVPGRYFSMSFRVDEAGTHDAFCTEFCGTGHSRMWAQVVVLSPADFERWVSTGQAPPQDTGPVGEPSVLTTEQTPRGRSLPRGSLADRGRQVAADLGCSGCHSADGREVTGPTWKNLWHRWEHLASGDSVRVDPAYITESMMDPMAKLVAGFEPVMPSFQGQADPAQVAAIVEYIRSLSSEGRDSQEEGR